MTGPRRVPKLLAVEEEQLAMTHADEGDLRSFNQLAVGNYCAYTVTIPGG